jgi:hypothetical protein
VQNLKSEFWKWNLKINEIGKRKWKAENKKIKRKRKTMIGPNLTWSAHLLLPRQSNIASSHTRTALVPIGPHLASTSAHLTVGVAITACGPIYQTAGALASSLPQGSFCPVGPWRQGYLQPPAPKSSRGSPRYSRQQTLRPGQIERVSERASRDPWRFLSSLWTLSRV